MDIDTDSNQVFDAVTKGRKASGKQLMIDVLSTPDAYRRFQICGTGIISGDRNPDDGLSELEDNGILQRLLHPSLYDAQVMQWIDRSAMQRQLIL